MAEMNEKEIMQRFEALRAVKPNNDATQVAVDKARAAIMQCQGEDSGASKKPFVKNHVFKFAVAACFIAAVFAGFSLLRNDKSTVPAVVKEADVSITSKDAERVATAIEDNENSFEARLAEMKKLFAAGDVKGLLALLDDGDERVRVAAAGLLARIGGADVIAKLTELSLAFNDGGDDPYMAVIAEIEEDLKQQGQQGQAIKEAEQAESVGSENVENQMWIYAVDENDDPIAGVNIHVYLSMEDSSQNTRNDYTTDDSGLCKFEIDRDQVSYLSLLASKAGFVTLHKPFRSNEKAEAIPEEFVFVIPAGTKIGGIVLNQEDEPVVGATVYVHAPVDGQDGLANMRIHDVPFTTDEAGKWVCDIMPAKIEQLGIKLAHPDYGDDTNYKWLRSTLPPMEKLRDLTAVLRMKRGIDVTGYVVDQYGVSIEGVSITQGDDRFIDSPEVTTDENGYFVFVNAEVGSMNLTVQAQGFAPQLREVNVSDNLEPLEIVLEPGYTIFGRVVDLDGKPVSDAWVCAEGWRKLRSLDWNTRTDDDGRFAWYEAPGDEVKLDINKKSFLAISSEVVTASEQEYEFVMHPEVVVSGNVVDAETNEPIKEFSAVKGLGWGENSEIWWDTDNFYRRDFEGGKYELRFDRPYPELLIKIEAKGYKPAVSRSFDKHEGSVVYDFALEKGSDRLSATVYQPDGTVAGNAKVYVVSPGRWVPLENYVSANEWQNKKEGRIFEADANGVFQFKEYTAEEFKLFAIHDGGYGEIYDEDFFETYEIHLQPWGRVEGEIIINGKPGANEKFHLYNTQLLNSSDNMKYLFSVDFEADKDGKFVVDKVLPGMTSLVRRVKLESNDGPRSFVNTNTKDVEIVSNETTYVTFDVSGRRVEGKFVFPLQSNISWKFASAKIGTYNPKGADNAIIKDVYRELDFPRPAGYEGMTVAEVLDWCQLWLQGPDGKDYQELLLQTIRERRSEVNQSRHYGVAIENDGSFWTEGVEPGDYEIRVTLYGRGPYNNIDHQNTIGVAKQKFTLPEISEDDVDVPLELGTITLKKQLDNKLEQGRALPELNLKDYDEKHIDLNTYRGKILLLNFWSINSATAADSDAQMDAIGLLQNQYANDERLEMLGISTLSGMFYDDLGKKYLKEKSITFKQGIMEADPAYYQIIGQNGYPFNILIDANGNVVRTGLKGQELEDAVDAALEKLTPVAVE